MSGFWGGIRSAATSGGQPSTDDHAEQPSTSDAPVNGDAEHGRRELPRTLIDYLWTFPYIAIALIAAAGTLGGARAAWWSACALIGAASLAATLVVPSTRAVGRLVAAGVGVSVTTVIGLVLLQTEPERADGQSRIVAVLTGADISRSDLRRATLERSDLSRVDARDACLAGADLTDSEVVGADFRGADLTGAVLTGVDTDSAAHWPTDAQQADSDACQP